MLYDANGQQRRAISESPKKWEMIGIDKGNGNVNGDGNGNGKGNGNGNGNGTRSPTGDQLML